MTNTKPREFFLVEMDSGELKIFLHEDSAIKQYEWSRHLNDQPQFYHVIETSALRAKDEELKAEQEWCEEMAKDRDHFAKENARLRELLSLYDEQFRCGADGTKLKCICGKAGCLELNLQAGDVVFKVSYADANKFEALSGGAE
jgi:hypothetical protein